MSCTSHYRPPGWTGQFQFPEPNTRSVLASNLPWTDTARAQKPNVVSQMMPGDLLAPNWEFERDEYESSQDLQAIRFTSPAD
jgi:hypothetical protein